MSFPHILAGAGSAGGTVVPGESAEQAVTYPALFVLVLLGSLVPVVPTGSLVSLAAVLALHQSVPVAGLALVFVTGAAAAFLGDLTLYSLGRRGVDSQSGSRWLERLRRHAPPERLGQAQDKLRDHEVPVLIVSRLIPAGRIPVMVACLLARMPTREFVHGNFPACLAWTVVYQLIGLLSGSVFPEPWEGIAAAVALTVIISVAPAVWRRFRAS
ncbi:DedA family protein [Streptomyces sp. WMMB 322]|uniref:DedA family protein n=1 Tax=Streptomyces sp. WMMB 322 TaxID=1286821 RepID=UPI0006E13090|nr:VTT domain-containing protein [Streptomyces sp. WMMB 322]SCK35414.1 membrane protein DedA, SNARE-associated domain [Streptomyces sp. WMMB 322]